MDTALKVIHTGVVLVSIAPALVVVCGVLIGMLTEVCRGDDLDSDDNIGLACCLAMVGGVSWVTYCYLYALWS